MKNLRSLSVRIFFLLGLGMYSSAAVRAETDPAINAALVQACIQGSVDDAKRAIEKGADINTRDEEGRQVLICSIFHRHEDVARLLIDKGANINAISKNGATALIVAALLGQTELSLLLIDRGADVNVRSGFDGSTALKWAASQGMLPVIQRLIDKGADINTQNDSGTTPLMSASYQRHPEAIKLLLSKGADPMMKDAEGKTMRDHELDAEREQKPKANRSGAIFFAFPVAFALGIWIRRRRHPEWTPRYGRLAVGWMLPAIGIGFLIKLLLPIGLFAMGRGTAFLMTSATRLALEPLLKSLLVINGVYLILSLAGCAGSILWYGDREWLPYLKKTAMVQFLIFGLAAAAGVLSYFMFK